MPSSKVVHKSKEACLPINFQHFNLNSLGQNTNFGCASGHFNRFQYVKVWYCIRHSVLETFFCCLVTLIIFSSDNKVPVNRAEPWVCVERGGRQAAAGAVRRLLHASQDVHWDPRQAPTPVSPSYLLHVVQHLKTLFEVAEEWSEESSGYPLHKERGKWQIPVKKNTGNFC